MPKAQVSAYQENVLEIILRMREPAFSTLVLSFLVCYAMPPGILY
jgi:hypothetical protein